MKNQTASPESVVVECELPDPPEKVWRALTDPSRLAEWLMPNDLRPEPGARFQFNPQHAADGHAPLECEVLDADPGRLLRWRQRERDDDGRHSIDSVVTFSLTATPNGGTRLRIVHNEFVYAAPHGICTASSTKASATVIPFKRPAVARRPRVRGAKPIVCMAGQWRRAA
jgi:uncharacterized protein YndB with AHSA1/START domain